MQERIIDGGVFLLFFYIKSGLLADLWKIVEVCFP